MVRANRTLSTLCAKILRADTRCRRRRWQWLVTDCALLTGSAETRRPVGNNLFISRHTRVPRVTCTSCGAYTNARTYSPYARASQPCVYVHACTQVHFSRLYMWARTPCTRRFLDWYTYVTLYTHVMRTPLRTVLVPVLVPRQLHKRLTTRYRKLFVPRECVRDNCAQQPPWAHVRTQYVPCSGVYLACRTDATRVLPALHSTRGHD